MLFYNLDKQKPTSGVQVTVLLLIGFFLHVLLCQINTFAQIIHNK